MDKITTQVIGFCTSCKSVNRHKLVSQPTPSETLDTINLDFLGLFPSDQYIFVMIDKSTKCPEVEFMRSTTARNVISALEKLFSWSDISNNIVSDNGPRFTSYELQ